MIDFNKLNVFLLEKCSDCTYKDAYVCKICKHNPNYTDHFTKVANLNKNDTMSNGKEAAREEINCISIAESTILSNNI